MLTDQFVRNLTNTLGDLLQAHEAEGCVLIAVKPTDNNAEGGTVAFVGGAHPDVIDRILHTAAHKHREMYDAMNNEQPRNGVLRVIREDSDDE